MGEAFVAVVLALPVPGADPFDVLAGLPLVVRTVLTVQKEGAERALLVVESEAAAERVRSDTRVTISVEAVVASDVTVGLKAAAAKLSEPFLLASHAVVADAALYRELRAAPLDGKLASLRARATDAAQLPLFAAPTLGKELEGSLAEAIARLEADGRIARLEASSAWVAAVDTTEGRRFAFRMLFEACRKSFDGVVSRHLNRHISIFVSKRIVNTSLTPNVVSMLTFLLGIAAALTAAKGGYTYTLLGAFLFQWNSILDGVDGELARVRFQQSKLGQWLDTISDDTSNVLFYAGLAIGARDLPFGTELAWIGAVGVGASLLTMAVVYAELMQIGSGDLYAIWTYGDKKHPGFKGALFDFFRHVVKKDFAILFFFGLAVAGVLPYALPIIAISSVSVLVTAIGRRLRQKKMAAAPGGSTSAEP
jgi:phosphatidylglycerophosphate synthase